MSDVAAALAANRAAADEFLAAADQAAPRWTQPRAPGKWSPSQVVEHVARSLEASADEVTGKASSFPTLPAFVRPIVRRVLFNRVLRRGRFPRAKTTRAFDPASGPASPAEGRARLEAALGRFEEACRSCPDATLSSTLFGTVAVSDYVRFQELHMRHHQRQLAPSAL